MPLPPVTGAVVVNQKIAVAISNSFYVVFCLIVVHIPNFIQIGQKTKKQRFAIVRLRLVGRVIQKMAVYILDSFHFVFSPILLKEKCLAN